MARASKAGTKKSGTTKKSATAKKASGTVKKTATKKAAAKKAAPRKAAAKKSATTRSSTSKAAATKTASGKATTKAPAKSASKTAAAARGKKARSPFDTRFLEQMKKLLHTERDTYVRQAANLKAEADSLVADLDPGDVQFDEESGEGDTIAVERNRDLSLAAKALEMVEEIDHALAKFDQGTYGICEVSGEPIPKERLEAIPWARERVEYKVGGFGRR